MPLSKARIKSKWVGDRGLDATARHVDGARLGRHTALQEPTGCGRWRLLGYVRAAL